MAIDLNMFISMTRSEIGMLCLDLTIMVSGVRGVIKRLTRGQ